MRPSLVGDSLILCEGKGDLGFMEALLAANGLECQHVEYPEREHDTTFGRSGFADYIRGLPARSGFMGLRRFIVVADNDDDPAKSFGEIVGLLNEAGLGQPAESLSLSQTTPAVGVVMVPAHGETGCLESLVIRTCIWDKAHCAEAFATCSECDKWSVGKRDKMKVRAVIAGAWKDDPALSTANIFSKPDCPFDMKHTSLATLAAFLRSALSSAS